MISRQKIKEINEMLEDDLSVEQIAKNLEVAIESASRYIRLVKSTTKRVRKALKILVLDIETAMMKIETWGILYKQRPQPHQIIEEWFCLAWAAKWLFDNNVMSDILTPEETSCRDDKRIMKNLWNLIDEADIIIGHNVANFDLRKSNARFIKHGLFPPMSYQIIDTLKIAKKNFAFSAYTLDYLCNLFNLSRKLETNYKLWKDCLRGDKTALKNMNTYNIQDVLSTEELYLVLRPWIKSHPNLGLYGDFIGNVCPNCRGTNFQMKGYYYTPAGRFESGRCNDCGAIFRLGQSDLEKEERKDLFRSVAR